MATTTQQAAYTTNNNASQVKNGTNDSSIPGLKQSQAEIVIKTWALVEQDPLKHGAVFYKKLFTEHPEVKPLFSFGSKLKDGEDFNNNPHILAQAKKLTNMITIAVHSLDDPPKLIRKLKQSGESHFVKYHVKEEHFPIVGKSLLWTLEQGLGDLYTSEAQEAWTAVYNIMAQVMIQAGKEAMADNRV